jgi:hypothetical protein
MIAQLKEAIDNSDVLRKEKRAELRHGLDEARAEPVPASPPAACSGSTRPGRNRKRTATASDCCGPPTRR